ncbi:MAG: aspartate--tRNA ligase [Bacteroidaceae bacterium]|nr:aspartate--tRNA ligase [Bacteroidaceae bacterium]
MYRTNTCGELRMSDVGRSVTLAGWVHRVRKMGGVTFVELRDRYGITQLVFNEQDSPELFDQSNDLGREYVIQIEGIVAERYSKNEKIATGDIEITVSRLTLLNQSEIPPFTIEENTDGGDDLRMKYRYLDLRRKNVRENLELRHRVCMETRKYLDGQGFLEIETPILINSTPEGARDFVVPSRMNPGQFYALPQSPQLFKQLLMVAGMDRYFQIVKCFRDEDLRADRQPEFTQIDCEMSFVQQDDVIQMFEGMITHLFKEILNYDFQLPLRRMPWQEAMEKYGSDKPDLRFGMEFVELTATLRGTGTFQVFNDAAYIGAICAQGCGNYSRKQQNELVDFVKTPQIGAKGITFVKIEEDGTPKSTIDKFYSPEQLLQLKDKMQAVPGDMIMIMCGDDTMRTRKQLCELRLEMGSRLGLRDKSKFALLWITDFPMFEWSEEEQRLLAMHHPFTSPKPEDVALLDSHPEQVRANAYDMVCNGVEIGGGSVRIHDSILQNKIFSILGLTPDIVEKRFKYLVRAFKYGAPPHAGLAYGLDRLVSLFAGLDSIRDCIAFPKNNSGRDTMVDAPTVLEPEQLQELNLKVQLPQ